MNQIEQKLLTDQGGEFQKALLNIWYELQLWRRNEGILFAEMFQLFRIFQDCG